MKEPKRSDLNRFELSKFDLQKIKELLKEEPKSSKELMEKLGVSSSVLKHRIDELMNRGEIESYEERSDRRKRLYKIADEEKVKVSSAVYLAAQFLECLKNPSFKEVTRRVENYEVVMSWFFEGGDKKKLDKIEPENLGMIADALKLISSVSKTKKVALVMTAEEK